MSLYSIPFQTNLLKPEASVGNSVKSNADNFSALHRDQKGKVQNPTGSITEFLKTELIPSKLEPFRKHIWAIGGKHAAVPLNYQIAFGREIIAWEDINLHLVWNGSGKIFIKPLPRFLLDSKVWREQLNSPNPYNPSPTAGNTRQMAQTPPSQGNAGTGQSQSSSSSPEADYLRSCALGFLYTYICLITHESDFAIAKEKKLLPLRNPREGTEIDWDDWKRFSREVLSQHSHNNTHWRFQRGELRLSRLNFFSRFTQFPLFTSYVRGWRGYGSLVRDNVT
ncbi:hypothetical protein GGR51DRAFT_505980 [Nemania sp. FL0031]|nr:hypothetical protein GGR51DRAFT_505980 [Nemania sp. FL0031]